MKLILNLITFVVLCNISHSQNDEDQIRTTLLNYIEGTSYNKTELIDYAFYSNAHLFLTKSDEDLWLVPIKEYIGWFDNGKRGEFNGRLGNILFVEQFNNIALAKVELLIPRNDLRYIDMFLLKKISNEWKIISKSADSQKEEISKNRILFVVSNSHYYGDSELPTGNSFSEIVNAYDTFIKAGYRVDFVSPNGGAVPLAYINTSNTLEKEYLYNTDFMYALKHTIQPKAIDPENYRAIQFIGGGSALFGVPENKEIQAIAMEIYEGQNGVISSVCHGTAGIVHLKTKDGKYLVDGKKISGYPDEFERKGAEYFKTFPFLITQTIEERGGEFKFSPRNNAHIEADGNLITGQNYLSSKGVALRIIERLKE